jgi:hypothetical protein
MWLHIFQCGWLQEAFWKLGLRGLRLLEAQFPVHEYSQDNFTTAQTYDNVKSRFGDTDFEYETYFNIRQEQNCSSYNIACDRTREYSV